MLKHRAHLFRVLRAGVCSGGREPGRKEDAQRSEFIFFSEVVLVKQGEHRECKRRGRKGIDFSSAGNPKGTFQRLEEGGDGSVDVGRLQIDPQGSSEKGSCGRNRNYSR